MGWQLKARVAVTDSSFDKKKYKKEHVMIKNKLRSVEKIVYKCIFDHHMLFFILFKNGWECLLITCHSKSVIRKSASCCGREKVVREKKRKRKKKKAGRRQWDRSLA